MRFQKEETPLPEPNDSDKVVIDAFEMIQYSNKEDQSRLEKALFKDVENVRLGQFFIFQMLEVTGFNI